MVTSEPGGERLDEDEDLIGLPLFNPCMFLMLLPRELRDKVRALSATFRVSAHALTTRVRIQIYGYVRK